MPQGLERTDMGEGLLGQDYLLKQLSASLTHPDSPLGRKFWDKVYLRACQLLGTTQIPFNTFNKVWIVPGKAVVYTDADRAIVGEARLKVMMEADYLAMNNGQRATGTGFRKSDSSSQRLISNDTQHPTPNTLSKTNNLTTQVMKEVILPVIEDEVNSGAQFSELRRIYNAVILAAWMKRKLKEQGAKGIGHSVGTNTLGSILYAFLDSRKLAGVDTAEPFIKEKIYNRYVEAYKKGVYDLTKKEVAPVLPVEPVSRLKNDKNNSFNLFGGLNRHNGYKQVRRRYFSGGCNLFVSGSMAEKPLAGSSALKAGKVNTVILKPRSTKLPVENTGHSEDTKNLKFAASAVAGAEANRIIEKEQNDRHAYADKRGVKEKKFSTGSSPVDFTPLLLKLDKAYEGLSESYKYFTTAGRNDDVDILIRNIAKINKDVLRGWGRGGYGPFFKNALRQRVSDTLVTICAKLQRSRQYPRHRKEALKILGSFLSDSGRLRIFRRQIQVLAERRLTDFSFVTGRYVQKIHHPYGVIFDFDDKELAVFTGITAASDAQSSPGFGEKPGSSALKTITAGMQSAFDEFAREIAPSSLNPAQFKERFLKFGLPVQILDDYARRISDLDIGLHIRRFEGNTEGSMELRRRRKMEFIKLAEFFIDRHFSGNYAIDARPVENGILAAPYVGYVMAVKAAYNPDDKDVRGVYIAAGPDLLNFFYSTNAVEGVFVDSNYSKNDSLKYYNLENVNDTIDEILKRADSYRDEKYILGYTLSSKDHIAHNLEYWEAIIVELAGLGVSRDELINVFKSLKEQIGKNNITIQFNWAYPLQKQKLRTVHFITGSVTDKSIYAGLTGKKFDFIYQHASLSLALQYREIFECVSTILSENSSLILDPMSFEPLKDTISKPIDPIDALKGSAVLNLVSNNNLDFWRKFIKDLGLTYQYGLGGQIYQVASSSAGFNKIPRYGTYSAKKSSDTFSQQPAGMPEKGGIDFSPSLLNIETRARREATNSDNQEAIGNMATNQRRAFDEKQRKNSFNIEDFAGFDFEITGSREFDPNCAEWASARP